MELKSVFTRVLAIAGTALACIPILAPILFSLLRIARGAPALVDYLMPAELFPSVLLGGGLLLWAAFRLQGARARFYRIFFGGALAAAVLFLVSGQALAVVTGLASGAREPEGFWWALVIASIALYILAAITVAVGGIWLSRALLKLK